MPSAVPDRSRLLALGWALFLACSWTWCIGMYLPVLMVRDYGPAGWFVFMVPNVVGAAAMGWALHKPGAAAQLARRHWSAAAAFSVVTILFHAFFAGWVIRALIGDAAWVILALLVGGFYFFGRRGRRDLAIAVGLFCLSVIAFIVAASLPHVRATGPVAIKSLAGLVWLAPICVFGFLLCPYLDLTFLRARASTEAHAGIAAFTLGFGLFFVVMLLFTLWYSRVIQPAGLHAVPAMLAWILAGHMMLQAGYTVALHLRSLSEDRRARKPLVSAAFIAAMALALFIGAKGERFFPAPGGMTFGELGYRLFMGFYALVFPAYVWICMIPLPRQAVASSRQRLVLLGITLVIAGPMFALGLLGQRMIWVIPGLGVVLLSRLALRLNRRAISAPAVTRTLP